MVPKCPWLFTQTRPCCCADAWGMYHAADGADELPVGSFDTASFQKLNWLMKSVGSVNYSTGQNACGLGPTHHFLHTSEKACTPELRKWQ
jgi:hypothetical protein